MPLVVPLLRLAMLFLNIYESYKTLKVPPPSARNEGRPSQRALTQRKRDMKGCLAVWIVWGCFITYEGFVEGLVSLFVPFYDEIKSLGLLFLIMTRARGAEPIFLHVIRPFVKPYSPTIDMFLDLARMVGDITFAVLAIPMELVCGWWKTSMFYNEEVLDSEAESTHGQGAPAAKVAATNLKRAVPDDQRSQQSLQFPKKVSSDRRPSAHSRHASGESERRPSQTRPRVDKVGQRAHANESSTTHQVWYPPPSSYSDEDDAREPSTTISGLPAVETDMGFLSSEAMHEREAVDEWRQYPPFPSAYPPTPIVKSSVGLPGTSTTAPRAQPLANSLILSEILEDAPQQDFSRSLLPPRKPLNPGFVDGLSDENQSPGVQSNRLESMSVDSDSEADDEEDIFNTTLQTPMPPLRATRSGIIPVIPINREVSMASSVASRSTALTTAGNESSLRTQSSSESLSSGALSISDLSSVLGKKRPLPADSIDVTNRVGATAGRIRSGGKPVPDQRSRRTYVNVASRSTRRRAPSEVVDEDTETTLSTSDLDHDIINNRKPSYPKRRKVITPPGRAVNATRPIRPRVARYATAPTRAQIPKPPKPSGPSRGHSRPQTRSTTRPAGCDASQASLSSVTEAALPTASRTTQPKAKPTVPAESR
ncbi:hypothetical protein D9615_000756 [Tricholomella constricta]|uniref:Uncharacterized protein n=1 Tax=Tricholomella constricta TaxID=117010 RepID=A0A8H5HQC3_9AGAR|nr:hypothetical protein D9615_000756 [Tricholomella constricta]